MAWERRRPFNVFRSSGDPTASEARPLRFYAGDIWFNTTTHSLFWLRDENTGVWVELIATAVPSTRTISTVAPLSGGGDLSANRTITTSMATDRLIGRDTPGTGVMEEIALGASLEFSGSASIQRAALTGDVTAAANGNATTIANDAVTYAKMQNVSAAARLIGRQSGSAGDPEELTATAPLVISGTALTASVFAASGGSHATGVVPDPGATAGTSALLREDATWVEFAMFVNATASTAILGTVEVETAFDQTVTIPANFFVAGDVVEIFAQGIHTVQAGTDSVVFWLKAGSTTVCNTGSMDPPAAPSPWTLQFQGVWRSVGASGALIGGGLVQSLTRAATTATAHRVATGSGTTSETVIDTTASTAWGVSFRHNTVATDTNSVRQDVLYVRVRRKMDAT
jgi:hypothetical protein